MLLRDERSESGATHRLDDGYLVCWVEKAICEISKGPLGPKLLELRM